MCWFLFRFFVLFVSIMKLFPSTSWSSIMLIDLLLYLFMLAYQNGASNALANPWSASGNRKKCLGSCKYRKEGLQFYKTYSTKFHLPWDCSVLSQAVLQLTFSTGQLFAGELSFSLALACCLWQCFPNVGSSALIFSLCLPCIEIISVNVKRQKLLDINPTVQNEN